MENIDYGEGIQIDPERTTFLPPYEFSVLAREVMQEVRYLGETEISPEALGVLHDATRTFAEHLFGAARDRWRSRTNQPNARSDDEDDGEGAGPAQPQPQPTLLGDPAEMEYQSESDRPENPVDRRMVCLALHVAFALHLPIWFCDGCSQMLLQDLTDATPLVIRQARIGPPQPRREPRHRVAPR